MSNQILEGMRPIGQYLPGKTFKPNMEVVQAALMGKQEDYDTKIKNTKEVLLRLDQVNRLDGDVPKYNARRAEYDARLAKLYTMYDGDITKADKELNNILDEVHLDFGPNGQFTKMQTNYDSAMKTRADLVKRQEDGDVGEGALHQFDLALKNYNDNGGIGDDANKWRSFGMNTITDYVNSDKFLNKFLKNKEHDLKQMGYSSTTNSDTGKIEYTKEGLETITKESLQEEAKAALYNAQLETGQIKWEYIKDRDRGAFKIQDKKLFLKSQREAYTTSMEMVNKIKEFTDKKDYTGLAKYMGETVYNRPGDFDQLNPKTLLNSASKTQQYLMKQAEASSRNYKDVEVMSNKEYEMASMHMTQYADEILESRVDPYSSAKSYERETLDLKVYDDPYLKQQFAIDLEKLKHEHAKELHLFTQRSYVPDFTSTTQLPVTKADEATVKDIDSYHVESGKLLDQEKSLGADFKLAVMDTPEGAQSFKDGMAVFREKSGNRTPTAAEYAQMQVVKDGNNTKIVIPYIKEDGSKEIVSFDLKGKYDPTLMQKFKTKAKMLHNEKSRLEDRFMDAYDHVISQENPQLSKEERAGLAKLAMKTGKLTNSNWLGGGKGKENVSKSLAKNYGLGDGNYSFSGYFNNVLDQALKKQDPEAIKAGATELKTAISKMKEEVKQEGDNWGKKKVLLDQLEQTEQKLEKMISSPETHESSSNWVSSAASISNILSNVEETMKIAAKDVTTYARWGDIGKSQLFKKVFNFNEKEFRALNNIGTDKKKGLNQLLAGKKDGAISKYLTDTRFNNYSYTSTTDLGLGEFNDDALEHVTVDWNDNEGNKDGVVLSNLMTGIPEIDEELSKLAQPTFGQFKAIMQEKGYSLNGFTGSTVITNVEGEHKFQLNGSIVKTDDDGKKGETISFGFIADKGYESPEGLLNIEMSSRAHFQTLMGYLVNNETGRVNTARDLMLTNSLYGETFSIKHMEAEGGETNAFIDSRESFRGVGSQEPIYDKEGNVIGYNPTEIEIKSFAKNYAIDNTIGDRLNKAGLFPVHDGVSPGIKQKNRVMRRAFRNALVNQLSGNNDSESLVIPNGLEYEPFMENVLREAQLQVAHNVLTAQARHKGYQPGSKESKKFIEGELKKGINQYSYSKERMAEVFGPTLKKWKVQHVPGDYRVPNTEPRRKPNPYSVK